MCPPNRMCAGSGPITMGVAVSIFLLFLIAIFLFDIGGEDEDGSGMNSKIKIIQTHFQVQIPCIMPSPCACYDVLVCIKKT